MVEQHVHDARDSLSRCIREPDFLDRFYELFMDSSVEIRKKFENTDFDRQKKVLQDSLFLMIVAAGTSQGAAHRELEKLAERHSRDQLAIKPEWYENWLDSLMRAVSEKDPDYAEAIDEAWRSALAPGIEFLKSRY